MSVMATKKRPAKSSDQPEKSGERPPSRDGYKGTYLPKDLYDELDAYAAAEDRSAAFFVKRAVIKFLAELRKGGAPGPSIRKPKREQNE